MQRILARAPARRRGARPRRRGAVRRAGRGPARPSRATRCSRPAPASPPPGCPSLADDSGLCVDALNGMPGRAVGALGGPAEGRRRATTSCCSRSSPTSPTSAAAPTSRCAVAFCHPDGDASAGRSAADARPGDPRGAGERRLRLRRAVRARRPGRRAHLGRADRPRTRTRSPTAARRCARSPRSSRESSAASTRPARLERSYCQRPNPSCVVGLRHDPSTGAARRGLEPPRPKAQIPKSCVSASSTTSATARPRQAWSARQSRPRSRRSLATWPVALTLYCASSMLALLVDHEGRADHALDGLAVELLLAEGAVRLHHRLVRVGEQRDRQVVALTELRQLGRLVRGDAEHLVARGLERRRASR